MPETEISPRGGAVRWRTLKLDDGRTIQVAVVRKAGPRGGHTVAGQPQPHAPEGKKKGKN